KIASEPRSGKNAVQAGNCVRGGKKKRPNKLQSFSETPEDVENFRCFIFGELHELVVGFQRFQWLEEHSLSRAARAVHDTGHAAAVFGPDGNDKSIVTQGNVILAGTRIARAQNLLQRFLDGVTRLRDARANPAQRR